VTMPELPDALAQDPTHPRPQLVRHHWQDLGGEWDFAVTDVRVTSPSHVTFDRRIVVPFPPESPASGVHETGFLGAVWYRRTVDREDLERAGLGESRDRVLLHLGAVDHAARVWLNGQLVATHVGGQTPFTADLTDVLDVHGDNVLVVRAVDPPQDVSVPRGKQDWLEQPHVIWYHRTTGIWQPVWLECVGDVAVAALTWTADVPTATVSLDVRLTGHLEPGARVHAALRHEGVLLAEASVSTLGDPDVGIRLVLPRQRNGQQHEDLLWSPEHPTLLDAAVVVEDAQGSTVDLVGSYLGLRTTGVGDDHFLLNDRPLVVRAVLAQNYWPETHLAATDAMLRREVELILSLGFNTARVHQKAEDPRFLYWADRLGLMVWAETANAYAFDARAVRHLVTEWTDLVVRDRSHPSIVTWVPLNESWGVQHISHDPRQQAYSRSLADLTRALDGTRPVVSNDGWEHTSSDLWTVHDYESDPGVLARRYADRGAVDALVAGVGPAGRRLSAGQPAGRRPVLLTEFGGVSLAAGGSDDWGYSTAGDAEALEDQVGGILRAVTSSRALAGFCYTQLTDTGQETNGLLTAGREPKIPVERVRRLVRGDS